jgi:hypothetical protein
MILSQIAQASLRSEILIEFDCYIDTEFGLLQLIKNNFLDGNVFNINKLVNQSAGELILSLIDRKEKNPLSVVANDTTSKEDLDDYYKEFMRDEYNNILKYSVTTEMKSLLELMKTEPSFHVTFLCKNEDEVNVLKNDSATSDCKFIIDNPDNDYSKFTAYYFKYISKDISKFLFEYKNYYFSKYRINFDEDFNLYEPAIVDKIIALGGSIEILDLYNKSYLMGGSN